MKYILKYITIIITTMLVFSCKPEKEPTIVVDKDNDIYSPDKIKPILDKWQRKTFNYFYEGASPTGLALEGNNRNDGGIVTIGGSGFGVMSLIVGAERGWITRNQAAEQTQKIVRFLGKAERFQGAWSHWYNPDGTSHAFGDQIKTGDLVETSFMMAGLLAAKEYYINSSSVESEIRDSVDAFWNTINWNFYTDNGQSLKWLWYSEENTFKLDISGWNESLITYILALAAPEPNNININVYKKGWEKNGTIYKNNRKHYDYELVLGNSYGGPLFFSHYSFLGLNPKKMENEKVYFWDQNCAHTMINRHYCIYEANKQYKYNEKNWGLTACYGAKPPKWNYMARSPSNDDGVIAPTASLSSYPYTPFYSTQVLLNLNDTPLTHGIYGFADAYAPITNTSEKKHLSIDQGPIVIMIENYRSGLIWNLLMKNNDIKKGLLAAGINSPTFEDGFIRSMINTYTKEYDIMRHPDRKNYELDYYTSIEGTINFYLINENNKIIMKKEVNASKGENTFSFNPTDDIRKGKRYTLIMKNRNNEEHKINLRLR